MLTLKLKRISKAINSISSSIRDKASSLLKVHIEKGRAASDALANHYKWSNCSTAFF